MEPTSFHDELMAACDETVEAGKFGAAAVGGGVVRQVLRGLAGDGFKFTGIGELVLIVSMIAELVQELGPKVAEIIDRIKAAFGK